MTGLTTQGSGTIQDVIIPSVTDQDAYGESKLLFALASDRIPGVEFEKSGDVTEEMRQALRVSAATRQEKEEFTDIRKRREATAARLGAASLRVSLSLLQAMQDEDAKPAEETKTAFGADPATHELLEITADLVRLSRGEPLVELNQE
jgi:hypothetical protein